MFAMMLTTTLTMLMMTMLTSAFGLVFSIMLKHKTVQCALPLSMQTKVDKSNQFAASLAPFVFSYHLIRGYMQP